VIPISDLETMDRAALLAAWSTVFGRPAPKNISRPFLRRFLAFELQARRTGGLPKPLVVALMRNDGKGPAKPACPALKPGGRLIREWNGVTHIVDVTETGFVWKGETWRSLSSIAREITGAHWSGPRFFSLGGKAT
jgi:hypothetical protein